jgi:hypothetical protein
MSQKSDKCQKMEQLKVLLFLKKKLFVFEIENNFWNYSRIIPTQECSTRGFVCSLLRANLIHPVDHSKMAEIVPFRGTIFCGLHESVLKEEQIKTNHSVEHSCECLLAREIAWQYLPRSLQACK